jgi:hypothetical protein
VGVTAKHASAVGKSQLVGRGPRRRTFQVLGFVSPKPSEAAKLQRGNQKGLKQQRCVRAAIFLGGGKLNTRTKKGRNISPMAPARNLYYVIIASNSVESSGDKDTLCHVHSASPCFRRRATVLLCTPAAIPELPLVWIFRMPLLLLRLSKSPVPVSINQKCRPTIYS